MEGLLDARAQLEKHFRFLKNDPSSGGWKCMLVVVVLILAFVYELRLRSMMRAIQPTLHTPIPYSLPTLTSFINTFHTHTHTQS